MKTGMKAPDGMGMVVATADIQNCMPKKKEMKRFSVKKTQILSDNNRHLPLFTQYLAVLYFTSE